MSRWLLELGQLASKNRNRRFCSSRNPLKAATASMPLEYQSPPLQMSKSPESEVDEPFMHLEIQDKDLESEKSLWDLYERFLSVYNVPRTPEEKRQRFSIFKEKVKGIHNFNKQGHPSREGLNQFSDLSTEEFIRTYCGAYP